MSLPDWNALADQALAGSPIARDDARAVLAADDAELPAQLAAAWRVRRHFWGNRVRLHFLLNAQSGLCPEDCGYCSQSKLSLAEIDKYPMLARDRILEAADRAAQLKAGTFCMVISGRSPGGRVFEKVLDAVREVKARHDLKICACLGLLTQEQAVALKEAGVTQVNHNLNTSARYTPEVVSTHTFEDRVATVEQVRAAGLKTCSGGILGMGETDDDVIDLALSLRELEVKSVPVNFLIPVPGTPMSEVRQLDPRRCLRILALYRFLLPSQEIRIAGGREVHLRSMQVMGLYPANSIFIGDYLTTQGAAARADLDMIRDAGFVLETPDGAPFEVEEFVAVPESYPRAPLPLLEVR
ncbi:biotin synthase BioB [Roseisolibacter sp. H3M3-2]|uniref:biotin synthase BioB n=1 Tax=Roseisolibacter sp. H3M3-2 TaxID=3031323 RepID=UPI0023DC293F|nr:biotin synthase BioB [Roseisolibacter sp. H3M3-2]MDF1505373.1 biotin synthase BioB [Roseisolibacter sp. H3M3-2]